MKPTGCLGRLALLLLALLFACHALAAPPRVAVEVPDVMVFKSTGMVALPPMLELYGAALAAKDTTYTITRAGKSFVCTLGKTAAQANGQAVTLELAPFKAGEVVFVPLRPLVTALGGTLKAEGNGLRVAIGPASYLLPIEKMAKQNEEGKTIFLEPKEYRDSNSQLYVMHVDGSSLRRLTYTAFGHTLPAFTPDGSKWVSLRNPVFFFPFGNVHARMLANGQTTRLYTGDIEKMTRMCLSAVPTPDGAAVLYSELSQVDDDSAAWIYRVPFIGGKAEKVTEGLFAAISPDGKLLAYSAPDMEKEKSLIVLQNLATGEKTLLGDGQEPQFNRAGNVLLFKRPVGAGKEMKAVFVTCRLNADPSKHLLSPVPENPLQDEEAAALSPDGQRIVIAREKEGLFSMKLDRSDERQLTTNKDDGYPVYSPDGAYLYFLRDNNVYRMKPDGSEITPLTKDRFISEMTLSPDGTQLFLLIHPQALFG